MSLTVVYKRLDKYYYLTPASLTRVVVTCLTLCILLLFALSNRLSKTYTGAILRNLLSVSLITGGWWAGAVEREASFIVLPASWMLGDTLLLAFGQRGIFAGINRLADRVSLRTQYWVNVVSLAGFIAVWSVCYGLWNEYIVILCLWEGVKLVYMKLDS